MDKLRAGDKVSASRLNAIFESLSPAVTMIAGESMRNGIAPQSPQHYLEPVMFGISSSLQFDDSLSVWTALGRRVFRLPCTIDENGNVTALAEEGGQNTTYRYIMFSDDPEETLYFPVSACMFGSNAAIVAQPAQSMQIVWAVERGGTWEVLSHPPQCEMFLLLTNLQTGGYASARATRWDGSARVPFGPEVAVFDTLGKHRLMAGDYAWCCYDYSGQTWHIIEASPMWQILAAKVYAPAIGNTLPIEQVTPLQPIGGRLNVFPTTAYVDASWFFQAGDPVLVFWDAPNARWIAWPSTSSVPVIRYGKVYQSVDTDSSSSVPVEVKQCNSDGTGAVGDPFQVFTLPTGGDGWRVSCKEGAVVAYVSLPSESERKVILEGAVYYRSSEASSLQWVQATGKPNGGNGKGPKTFEAHPCHWDGTGVDSSVTYTCHTPKTESNDTAIFEGTVVLVQKTSSDGGTGTASGVVVGGDWTDDPIGTIKMCNHTGQLRNGWREVSGSLGRYLRVGAPGQTGGSATVTPYHLSGQYAPDTHTITIPDHETSFIIGTGTGNDYQLYRPSHGPVSGNLTHPILAFQDIQHGETSIEPLYYSIRLIERFE